jgi:hypothetical protein
MTAIASPDIERFESLRKSPGGILMTEFDMGVELENYNVIRLDDRFRAEKIITGVRRRLIKPEQNDGGSGSAASPRVELNPRCAF